MSGRSGIAKYSKDFYELVLKQQNYLFLDSEEDIVSILSTIASRDHVHIEIGIFQKKEMEILMAMLDANYKSIAVTLHDPPLFKYPFREFRQSFINKISKFYDVYIDRFKKSGTYVSRIKYIYVLSQKGLSQITSKYKVSNVYYLPHIVNQDEIEMQNVENKNFIYFGFVGKNKGLEYSLRLHQKLISRFPEMQFYVVGDAIGKAVFYFNYLKSTYKSNVHYLGYVAGDELPKVFSKATFALVIFKKYKFYFPFSGSLLSVMKYGKIPLTNNVNAVSEIISDKMNGFFLTGELNKDAETIEGILKIKTSACHDMHSGIRTFLTTNCSVQNVQQHLLPVS